MQHDKAATHRPEAMDEVLRIVAHVLQMAAAAYEQCPACCAMHIGANLIADAMASSGQSEEAIKHRMDLIISIINAEEVQTEEGATNVQIH